MSEPAAGGSASSPRFVMRSVVWILVFALLLFVPAGTLHWPGAWAFLAIMAVASFGGVEWLRRHDPELLRERLKPPFQRDQKPWDKVLMATFLPLWFAWFVLMAIDRRFGGSDVPVFAQVLGAVLVILGMVLGFRVLKENSYAAPVVKLQKDRGHRVVSTGPYSYMRHPMYTSALFLFLGLPLLLGSWWGLCAAPLLVVVLAVRAVMEQRTLASELEGYDDYAARIRYRFVPYLW
jgi:protein-S-isoprenylcysteine O-methyltransferase Ste14